jgi:site-specific DNA-cytosine methylase
MDVNRFSDAALSHAPAIDGMRIPKSGEVEMLNFGPPCQGVSKLNKFSTGENATYSNSLFSTSVGLVDHYRPMFGMMENVTGLIDASNGRLLQAIVKVGRESSQKYNFFSIPLP